MVAGTRGEDGVHIKQKENGEAYLIEACERIRRSDEVRPKL